MVWGGIYSKDSTLTEDKTLVVPSEDARGEKKGRSKIIVHIFLTKWRKKNDQDNKTERLLQLLSIKEF